MTNMYNQMMTNKAILEIGTTAKTTELGRWNAYTTVSQFATTTKWLQNNLSKIYEESNHSLDKVPTSFIPEVRFNTIITIENTTTDNGNILHEVEKSVKQPKPGLLSQNCPTPPAPSHKPAKSLPRSYNFRNQSTASATNWTQLNNGSPYRNNLKTNPKSSNVI